MKPAGCSRRLALRHLAAAGLGVGLAGPALAKPARAADFAAAVATQPLLAPFKGVTDAGGDLDCPVLRLRGRWPAQLQGRFYRNEPALFERGGERYHHWFDGEGMVQQFTLGAGRTRTAAAWCARASCGPNNARGAS